jgi:hypothetical protein
MLRYKCIACLVLTCNSSRRFILWIYSYFSQSFTVWISSLYGPAREKCSIATEVNLAICKSSAKEGYHWDLRSFGILTTERRPAISPRRFGTTYRSQIQGSRSPRRTSWPLNMGSIGCPETSVLNCHHALRNIPEELRSNLLCGRSLKARNALIASRR